jgi:hypothetical protein
MEQPMTDQQLPSVIPMISYEDGVAAVEWLTKVSRPVGEGRYLLLRDEPDGST